MASSNKTRIEIELGIDKRDMVREIERIQKNPPKIDISLLANNSDAVGIARALEREAKSARGRLEDIRKIAEISRSTMSGAGAAAIGSKSTVSAGAGPILHMPYTPASSTASASPRRSIGPEAKKRWREQQNAEIEDFYEHQLALAQKLVKNEEKPPQWAVEFVEGLREEEAFVEQLIKEKEKTESDLEKTAKYARGRFSSLSVSSKSSSALMKAIAAHRMTARQIKEIPNSISLAVALQKAQDKAEQKRINSGLDKVVQMDGVQSLMETTGKELQAASGGGGRGKPPVKQQQKYNELLKVAQPLLSAVGITGWKSFTAIGTAVAALTATTLKLVSRMKEAEEFAKSLHLIGNELQGLATRINVLGYYTDDMINQFVDAQVQAEKLAWQNRFLTEEDKQLAETFRGLRTGLSAFAGTMIDIVGQIVSDFLPSFESVREFMVNQVAPAAAVVVTAFEVMADGIKTAFNLILGIFAKFVSTLLDIPTYVSNVGHNLGAIVQNALGKIGLGMQAFMEDYIFLLPDHLTNFFKGFGENLKIFGSNVVKFFSTLASNIGKFIQGLTWENLKKWWKGEINLSEMFNANEMESLFKDWDSDSAMYKRDASGKVMLDKNGNKIVDTERGFVDTDAKIRQNKALREKMYLQGLGLTEEDMKDPEKVKAAYSLMRGVRDLTEGTGQGLAGEFSAAGDLHFAEIGKTLDKYSGGIEGIEKKNKEKIAGLMQKNWQQEAEKDRPTFNMGPWERLQTLLTQNQKASTESLASAYDRINNAVANRNPVVEAIQKQMESQRAFEEETKAMDKKSLEYQERSKEQEEKMAGALQGIYDFLHRNNPQLAAVVEG